MGVMSELSIIERQEGRSGARGAAIERMVRNGTPYHEAVKLAERMYPRRKTADELRTGKYRSRFTNW